ncbi:MAG: ABC transporter ATP-binding protein [SAR202 cluster bacterium]|nr:ABC transporter ATP-binding protein [SAR202 cluster bacterium]
MRIILRLIGYGWRQKWHLAGAYAAMAGATLAGVVVPRLTGGAIDAALQDATRTSLLTYAAVIILASAVRGAFGYPQSFLAQSVSLRAAFDLRNDYFRKLQTLSFGFYDKQQTGNLMSRATADVDAVRNFMGESLISIVSIIIMISSVSGIMLTTNVRLGLVTLATVPIVIWLALNMRTKLHTLYRQVQAETGQMTAVLQENLSGMKVVKTFGAADYEEAKFAKKVEKLAELRYRAGAFGAFRMSQMAFIFTALTGITLWVGGNEVVAGRLTPGELTTFILYIGVVIAPIRRIARMIDGFTRATAAGQRLFEVLDAESPVKEKHGAKVLPRARGHVRYEGVSLSYTDDSVPAVRNIEFEAQPGQMVAILGGPGSGKSSVVHLLPRFYEVTAGRITIDDTDIRDVTLKSLRQNVGIVMQDVFLFAGSIRHNIAYGRDEVTAEEVEWAARVAQIHDHIEKLPRGYDTSVGERGLTLSGGQRQRLAIARTLLLDPPILILDDSTSSVDMGTEFQIQQALAEVTKDRTTIVIAHRLSTVRRASLILVLERGEVVERGSHEELIAKDGFYKKIYDLQFRPQEDLTSDAIMAKAAQAENS